MRVNAKLGFNDAVVYLAVLEGNRLAVVDSSKQFTVVDLASMKHLKKLTLKHAQVHREKKAVCFSPDGKYLAFSEEDQSVVRVIDVEKQTLHHSFPTLGNTIETLCFDPQSHYLVAGATTGRVFLWNLFSSGQVSRLSSFPEYAPHIFTQPKTNYVSAACFSPSGELVAATGYGGSIVITNIYTEVSPKRITPNRVRINVLCFIGEDTIAAGNIEGGLDIINLQTSQVDKHYQTNFASVKRLCISRSGSYLFIAGGGKHVSLLDLRSKKIIDTEYITLPSNITSMTMSCEDVLFVGCDKGSIHIYDLSPSDTLNINTDAASYAQAYDLLYEYPLLSETPLKQQLEKTWEQTLEDAVNKVENSQTAEAKKSLDIFSKVKAKQASIREFQGFVSNFERFKTAVEHENFALAYNMAEHIPLLMDTMAYKHMETLWDEAFLKAQTYVITGKTHALFKALEPYSRVTVKLCFIQVLLHKPELFLEFTRLINTRHYEKIFSIANEYPCLKEIESYKNIIHAANELSVNVREHISSRNYDLAKQELQKLTQIPYMQDELEELRHILSLVQKLEAFYTSGDLFSCYTYIDKYPELHAFSLVHKMEASWKEKMKEAEREALLGNTKKIKLILGELLALKTRAQKVGMLLRQSFLVQLKLLVIKNKVHLLKEGIDNYIFMFAYDTELHNLIKRLEEKKIIRIDLSPEQEHRRPRGRWLNITGGNVPDSILTEIKDNDSPEII